MRLPCYHGTYIKVRKKNAEGWPSKAGRPWTLLAVIVI